MGRVHAAPTGSFPVPNSPSCGPGVGPRTRDPNRFIPRSQFPVVRPRCRAAYTRPQPVHSPFPILRRAAPVSGRVHATPTGSFPVPNSPSCGPGVGPRTRGPYRFIPRSQFPVVRPRCRAAYTRPQPVHSSFPIPRRAAPVSGRVHAAPTIGSQSWTGPRRRGPYGYYGYNRWICRGNAIASRICGIPQIHATVRSTPSPNPE